MVDVEKAARSLSKLTLLKFFPADPDARGALLELVCNMAQENDHIDWLCRRALQVFNEWPGPQELRALYCKKYWPRDGVEVYSSLYPAGFPSENELDGIAEADPMPALPPGKKASVDINIEKAVVILGTLKQMARPPKDYTKRRTAKEVDEILEGLI